MSPRRYRAAAASNGEGGGSERRAELLAIAAELFADRGFRATTIREIAEAAGILSGSLYHHFDSKESMVDEILSLFREELVGRYQEILGAGLDPRTTFEGLVKESFEAIDHHRAAIAIFQNESKYLSQFPRFAYLRDVGNQFEEMWLEAIRRGVEAGVFREDLDIRLVYRFIRDTVWVAVRWYRPGGMLSAEAIADQYLAMVLDGIARPGEPAVPVTGDAGTTGQQATA